MVAQLCEYTKNHGTVPFKMASYVVGEFYLNKKRENEIGYLGTKSLKVVWENKIIWKLWEFA